MDLPRSSVVVPAPISDVLDLPSIQVNLLVIRAVAANDQSGVGYLIPAVAGPDEMVRPNQCLFTGCAS